MGFSRGTSIAALLTVTGAAHASMPPVLDWLRNAVFKKISITGRRSLGVHVHEVSGDKEAFNNLNYYGEGGKRFTDTGQVTLIGNKVFGFFNFNMTLTDDRYTDPQSKRVWLDYRKDGLQVGYGDLTAASLLNTNDFARYTKTLSGATLGYTKGRFAVKALRTESKSSARTRSIQGGNTLGPYFIGDSQIINDSEEIKVDGVLMRQGQDYTINYQVGTITFVTRMIAPTSTIVVSYETLGFNSTAGVVQGAGLSYDMGKAGKIGLTAMEQRSGGSVGLKTYVDKWQGLPANTAYTLEFEPIPSRPIIVKVNGILQTLGVDYTFAQDNQGTTIYAIVYFFRSIPSNQEVTFTYTPKPVQTIDGDRRVIGFDYRLPLGGRRGFLHYSQASGELKNDLTPLSGTARGLKGEYQLGDLKLRGSWKDVPNGYVSVESRGFNRNEKGVEAAVDYMKKDWAWGVSANKSDIAFRTVNANNTITIRESRFSNQHAFISFTPQSNSVKWSLDHNRTQSQYSGNDTKIDTTSLSASKSFGRLNARLGLEHQQGRGPVTLSNTTEVGDLSLDAIRLTADYSTNSGWFFGTRASLTSTKTLGKSGAGRDYTLSTSYRPASGPFDFEASYTDSNSGSLASLGTFQNGTGIGYGGNGFSSGGVGSPVSYGASDYRLLQFTPNYRLGSRATLNGRFYQSRSNGLYSYNAETTAYGLGVTWDLGNNTLISTSLDRAGTRFVDLDTDTDSTSVDFAVMGSPKGPWSYRFGVTSLVSGKTTDFAQDSFGMDGYMRYKINRRSNTGFQFSFGRTSGYLPQTDNFVGAFYEHQLYQNVSLVGSYKWRRVSNQDNSISGGAYRSNGFDLELNFNFGG